MAYLEKIRKLSSIVVVLGVFLIACKHEPLHIPGGGTPIDTLKPPVVSCDYKEVCFESTILPIFKSSCAMEGCHDAITRADGFVLDNYNGIVRRGVDPGSAATSKIFEVLSKTGDKQMPPLPASPLPQAQKDSIAKWINEGAKNTITCNCSCDTARFTYSGVIQPLLQSNCTGCHNINNLNGGIDLSNYNSVKAVAVSGKLIGVISHANGFPPMPKNSNKLSDCQIKQVDKWIKNGTLNN
jgi:hypothetical protein